MYAPPADRTSPWLAELVRLQAERNARPTAFAMELAAARNEVAHYPAPAGLAPHAASGLVRRSRLHALD